MVNEKQIKDYTDLNVWKKAYEISLMLHKLTLTFPQYEQFELGSQMRRASKGICANIAEGFGKQGYSKAEFKRFLLIAMGSADEMRVWIRYCFDLGYLDNQKYKYYLEEYKKIAKMLNGLHKSWQ